MLCLWLQGEQEDVIAFLREENRVLKARLEGRRLRLDDHERRRLAELGYRLGRRRVHVLGSSAGGTMAPTPGGIAVASPTAVSPYAQHHRSSTASSRLPPIRQGNWLGVLWIRP